MVFDTMFAHDGTRHQRFRTDILFFIGDRGGLQTDVTVVGTQPGGVCASGGADFGARNPDCFVDNAERRKTRKYADRCNRAGYDFTPCAFTTGGRPGRGAIRLFRSLVKAAGDRVEPWYFYACLLPRVFLALAIEQYKQDAVTRAEILARLQCAAPWTSSEDTAPPGPAASSRPFADDAMPQCDARWGPTADGRCVFVPTRGAAYEEFLRTHAPEFFAATTA